jgi:thiamine kinase-like enzyme
MPPSGIESLARRYVPGQGAIAIERRAAGLVNESYRVTRGGDSYSLRVPASDAAELGLEREWECRVRALAGAEGIAPRVEHCDPQSGVLVARWMEGRAWTPEETRHEENIERIARLMRRVHALPPPAPPRTSSPAAWIAFYRAALARRGADPMRRADAAPGAVLDALAGSDRARTESQLGAPDARTESQHGALDLRAESQLGALDVRAESHLAALAALPPPPAVLCHGDLHAQNLVAGPRGMVLLDWEYAHVTQPLWDLAGWICNNDLDATARTLLLDRYLGRRASDEDAVRLWHLMWLYDYVCLLWGELYLRSRGRAADQGIRERGGILAARLASSVGNSPVFQPGGRAG